MSKVKKMKAIHNLAVHLDGDALAVVTMSKVKKMKAIHNDVLPILLEVEAVVTMSKVKKMKAIHNAHARAGCLLLLL